MADFKLTLHYSDKMETGNVDIVYVELRNYAVTQGTRVFLLL
jgi:hypothetical protein